MKTIAITMTIFFATFSQAQQKDYPSLWKDVEKHEAEGLPKSALATVETIYTKAQKEKNSPQLIKSLLYKSKYMMVLEEDAQLKVVSQLKHEIKERAFPTKNILESILANTYWQYFNQNRWRFYDRTNTEQKVDEEDFRTWDLQTLFDEIDLHFQHSLDNGLQLQLEDLATYNDILYTHEDSKRYRPTLFDFLAHNALEFYTRDETSITKPAYKFEVDNPKYLSKGSAFSTIEISSKDKSSLQLKALLIYQKLIRFHQNDKDQTAFADVNINRLHYVRSKATAAIDPYLVLKTLIAERNSVSDKKIGALYDFERAKILDEFANKYNAARGEEHRWERKEAKELCQMIVEKFPQSLAAKKAKALLSHLDQRSMSILAENYIPVGQPSRLLINYRNYEKATLVIHSIDRNKIKKFNRLYQREAKEKFISTLKVYKQFDIALRNEGDLQSHTTEVIFPALPNDSYIVVAKNGKNYLSHALVQVTDMALTQKTSNEKTVFQLIDRNNGKPVEDAAIVIEYTKDYRDKIRTKRANTDNEGEFIFEGKDYHQNIVVEATKGKEKAFFGDYYHYGGSYRNNDDQLTAKTFLFTDRSIYRPGQAVYFKGILIQRDKETSTVVADESVEVTLKNVNREEIGKLSVITNEFGSFSGKFILPKNTLTGNFSISANQGKASKFYSKLTGRIQWNQVSFSVEEYKRPKFESKFEPITKSYKINDSVEVTGNALAYAGSNITDAKVVYRVKRKVQYPRWYYWYRPWFSSEPQEITNGETTTNSEGAFKITFKAQPDTSIKKENRPIFEYEVTAEITDINGETRSATTIVRVGYHSLIATIAAPSSLNKESKDNTVAVNTQNLNGQFVGAKGVIEIYKLKAPENVLRNRPWPAPDYQDIPKATFKDKFPHEAYKNEDDPKNWEKGEKVFEENFNTNKETQIDLGRIKKWESGQYLVELHSKDRYGQDVKDVQQITIFSSKDNELADNQLFAITTDKNSYSVGEKAVVTVATAAKDLWVTLDLRKNQKTLKTYIIHLNNEKKDLTLPIAKEDLGGFSIFYSYAAFNGHAQGKVDIVVPYPETQLQIETLTFRDKLQPGQEETWKFNIKGPKGDAVAAELLASMYDASLDQFRGHYWYFNPNQRPYYYSGQGRNADRSFGTVSFQQLYYGDRTISYPIQHYDQLNWFGFSFGYYSDVLYDTEAELDEVVIVTGNKRSRRKQAFAAAAPVADQLGGLEGKTAGVQITDGEQSPKSEKEVSFEEVAIRKNLQETAFFFPQLQTDKDGNVSFNFTTPEALTRWKLQLLAHTKALNSTTQTLTTVTQKELMVLPNPPRFFREGDVIVFSSKIANISDKALSGEAVLELTDAATGDDITSQLLGSSKNPPMSRGGVHQSMDGGDESLLQFSIGPKGNTSVSWTLTIPKGLQAVQYKVIAKAGDFSDGEQNMLPVLTNRMLVTETLPMWVRSEQTKTFTLDKLKNNSSSTLVNHQLTLEMTSNPAWYAVQALPYLMEYPYECAEQTFARYYANALASHIANSNPRIRAVFDQWQDADALISNLEKNEELKSMLIQETPWLRDAQSETQQKKRIALLFDLNTMNNELQSSLRKLKQVQMDNGAWSWFKGGRPNRWITQHIATGYGHLEKLGVSKDAEMLRTIEKAIPYLDREFVEEYERMKRYAKDLDKDHLSYTQLHYLYMRSFFPDVNASKKTKEVMTYYKGQAKKYWLDRNLYSKGMIALVLYRMEEGETSKKILKSLKETSITNEELGMYWKSNTSSWYWYQAPIETQALMIEVFGEIENDTQTIDNLKVWLLKNKQTNQWKTTKATTEAVYALLLQGSDWLSVIDEVEVLMGNQEISPSKLDNVKIEAGTGYYKTSWSKGEIQPEMAQVSLRKKGKGIAWGALYWQYFEDLDKISFAETPLKLKKQLFLKKNTDKGEQITAIDEKTMLNVGDLIRVRIELRSDRDMEFVHMKDMRAAGLEPIDVISLYKWQDGLGYYQSTKDAATNFFFDYLPKGVYVFEYDLRVNNAGNFSNGITTIQSMYAPEFTSHSEGIRISVK
ncbi:alpha-2-macroglobulin [Sungkyunkwania multivorans]|uniref:Alpha-2-macroglobulin n=1 Tax=Sungkyunkwania multivorans TaxID=1173618 RepID=A0ABW3CVC0_9FLAO